MRHRQSGEPIGEGLKLISRCPLCRASYDPLQARTLSENEDAHLVHVSCRKCENSVLALIFISRAGAARSVGLVTDCSYDDVVRFRRGHEVTVDDAIAFHELAAKQNFITQLKTQAR